jgi:hypothetical protein
MFQVRAGYFSPPVHRGALTEADQFLEIEIRRGQLSEFVNAAVRDK